MTDRELLQQALDALEKHIYEYETIQAIKVRLAQPEPVATGFIRTLVEVGEDGIETWKNEPFYTAPQKKEWVGLTDGEFADILCDDRWQLRPELIMLAVQEKLKEKNSGCN